MKKYELYKIISVYKSDGAADVMPNLSRQAHHQLEIFLEISLFRDRRSNIPMRLSADSDR